ncbi:sigma 54-interacting transcriptional regulator, partial [Myxococcota bacterium]|nr:sigma 54-interacting transcriptional regulator [Myxococcota bacterium]
IIDLVTDLFRQLEARGQHSLQDFLPQDRGYMQNAYIFDFFYAYRHKFDQLIAAQSRAGDTPVKIPFAPEAIALLEHRGFTKAQVRQYFALAWQLRRAFYFIETTLVGRSNIMKKLRHDLWNNVFTHNLDLYARYLFTRMEDFSTLILGGTGTGKGTAAAAIGRSGFIPYDEKNQCFVESYTQSFVSLNLSQFPESLLESELFGHRKGAFTGAVEEYRGVFDRCSPHGAILLDEIGEVSIPVQIKLLQVLQDRTFTPMGSHVASRFKGRVIAATNRNILQDVTGGVFRSDFYYRLCSDIITVPSLKQRIEDDPQELTDLLSHVVERMVGRPTPELEQLVRENIERHLGPDYPWPGNVRELEQCVRRVLLKGEYKGAMPAGTASETLMAAIEEGTISAQSLTATYCRFLYARHKNYEEVGRLTGLDRRTVKKYTESTPAP